MIKHRSHLNALCCEGSHIGHGEPKEEEPQLEPVNEPEVTNAHDNDDYEEEETEPAVRLSGNLLRSKDRVIGVDAENLWAELKDDTLFLFRQSETDRDDLITFFALRDFELAKTGPKQFKLSAKHEEWFFTIPITSSASRDEWVKELTMARYDAICSLLHRLITMN